MNPKPKPHHPTATANTAIGGSRLEAHTIRSHTATDLNTTSITKLTQNQKSAFKETARSHLSRIPPNQCSSTECEAKVSTNPSSSQDQYDRTMKVAKKEYSDHGSHGVIVKSTLLKKMTTSLQDVYDGSGCIPSFANPEEINRNVSNNNNHVDDNSKTNNETKLSSPPSPPSPPQVPRHGKKRLSTTKDTASSPNLQHGPQSSYSAPKNMLSSNNYIPHPKPDTGLLHAALQEENAKHHGNHVSSNTEITSSTTLETATTSGGKNKCLTNPMEPTSNEGLDNIEGNLIVHENDYIQVANGNIHLHQPLHPTKSKISSKDLSYIRRRSKKESYTHPDPSGTTTYQVIDILGQGTFAQVFKCKNLDTGQLCALKIVKNKPAYTRQAAIEIEIFIALSKETTKKDGIGIQLHNDESANTEDYMVSLLSYFLYQSHLCLVFELLGSNLYEVLKRRQFRGLPIHVVRNFIKEAIHGTNHLSQKNIVHCDLKPENILVVSDDDVEKLINGKSCTSESKNIDIMGSHLNQVKSKNDGPSSIRLIDFGSACFEGQATHTYIQSRFYRSPEVLIGLDYDSAIDMWSLGCVAAELFLGLPILPGIHEHDQLGRICEMIGRIPDWMVERGKKSKKYFVREATAPTNARLNILQTKEFAKSTWRLKTRDEFIKSLSEEEKQRCGGQSKLEQPSANRYFKKKLLEDIVLLHGNCSTAAEKESLLLFVHFLKGILHPDPCERWTAFQAATHPFITGKTFRSRNANEIHMGKGKVKIIDGIYWSIPWDPSVCRRILSFKQNQKSGRSNLHMSLESHKEEEQSLIVYNRSSVLGSPTSRVTDMAGSLSISMDQYHEALTPPAPPNLRQGYHPQAVYQTPTQNYQLSNSMINETNTSHFGQTSNNSTINENSPSHYSRLPSTLSMSLHSACDLNLEPPVDLPVITDRVVVPTMPMTVGAQSFSGVFHGGGGITHALQGDFGYALQRPGVVPTGAGVGHLTHIPINQQIYLQPQPLPQQSHFMGPSSYHSQTSEIGHYTLSGSYTGSLPNHFMGPLSPPQNHVHMSISLEHLPQDGAYSYGTGLMPHSAPLYQPNLQNHPSGHGHHRRRGYE